MLSKEATTMSPLAEVEGGWNRVRDTVVARAWTDEAFKARLLANPASVLRAFGVEVPPGVAVTAAENTSSTFHLVLPERPADEDVTSELLEPDQLLQISCGTRAGTTT
jgi:hypothetical protein